MIAQLCTVALGFKMIPVTADIKIPQSCRAFTSESNLVNADTIEKELNIVIDQLLENHHKPKSTQ